LLSDPTTSYGLTMMDARFPHARRWILCSGAFIVLLMGILPPWIVVTPPIRVGGIDLPKRIKPIGYTWIFLPPNPADMQYAGDAVNEVLSAPAGPAPTLQPGENPFHFLRRARGDDSLATGLRMVQIDWSRLTVQWIAVLLATILLAAAFFPPREPV
jgi:hypothetical protein